MPERPSALSMYLGPWWSALLHASDSNNGSNGNGKGVWTTTIATVGMSILLLQALSRSNNDESNNNSYQTYSKSIYPLLKRMLGRIVLGSTNLKRLKGTNNENKQLDESSDDDDEGPEVIYRGSCHCRSVQFEMIAPQCLQAVQDGTGKIHYPNSSVSAVDFRFTQGIQFLQMYYVSLPAKVGVEPIKAAHSFCSRCGVHILHAPDSSASLLEVNLDCIELPPQEQNIAANQKVRVKYINSSKESNNNKKSTARLMIPSNSLSRGIPIVEQWNNDENNNNNAAVMHQPSVGVGTLSITDDGAVSTVGGISRMSSATTNLLEQQSTMSAAAANEVTENNNIANTSSADWNSPPSSTIPSPSSNRHFNSNNNRPLVLSSSPSPPPTPATIITNGTDSLSVQKSTRGRHSLDSSTTIKSKSDGGSVYGRRSLDPYSMRDRSVNSGELSEPFGQRRRPPSQLTTNVQFGSPVLSTTRRDKLKFYMSKHISKQEQQQQQKQEGNNKEQEQEQEQENNEKEQQQ